MSNHFSEQVQLERAAEAAAKEDQQRAANAAGRVQLYVNLTCQVIPFVSARMLKGAESEAGESWRGEMDDDTPERIATAVDAIVRAVLDRTETMMKQAESSLRTNTPK